VLDIADGAQKVNTMSAGAAAQYRWTRAGEISIDGLDVRRRGLYAYYVITQINSMLCAMVCVAALVTEESLISRSYQIISNVKKATRYKTNAKNTESQGYKATTKSRPKPKVAYYLYNITLITFIIFISFLVVII